MIFHGFIGIEPGAYPPDFCQNALRFYGFMARAGFVGDGADPLRATGRARAPADVYSGFNGPFWATHYLAYIQRFGILQSAHAQAGATIEIQHTATGAAEPPWRGADDGRTWTKHLLEWMVFLDGVDEGGEIVFHDQALSLRPEPGTLLIWPSAFTHTHSLQAPRSGDRHVLRGWVEAQ